ncbi:MAG: UPF0280 family protein [Pseudomonadota bacterium]
MTPTAHLLPDGQRLHLQHGPSDLIIWAEGAREIAYRAAAKRFETIIAEIVNELTALREMMSPLSTRLTGAVAQRMHDACLPFAATAYVTRMAAVAGSVADEVLAAMTSKAELTRAYVNNGGDIALHLEPGTSFRTAMKGHDGTDLGRIEVTSADGVRGIATSGRHGRSLSLGIADSVTVLASSAAQADVGATMIANAVDLPGHPAITRRAAHDLDDSTDLEDLPVVTGCGGLSSEDCRRALNNGYEKAAFYHSNGLVKAAALFLQGHAASTSTNLLNCAEEHHHVEA